MNIRPRMSGEGEIEKADESAIEMSDPMQDLISDESDLKNIVEIKDERIAEAMDAAGEEIASKVIDAREAPIEELLPQSDNPGFDDREVQDARVDREEEGGVTNPTRSTGPMKSTDPATEGGLISQDPLADSKENAYELSGFHVEVPTGAGMVSQQITINFDDLETAKASVNGEMFLMPLQGRVKACRITRGAPIICFNERQLLEYIGGKWRKP